MICQDCGVEAATKFVSFHQNIGALVVRFPKSIEGRLCKSCIHKHFWRMTGTTFVLGWWGMISLIVTPIFLLNNIGRYLFCIGMPAVAPGATPPELTNEVIERITRHGSELINRLNDGEDFATVATSIADTAGVTPGQVALYVDILARDRSQR